MKRSSNLVVIKEVKSKSPHGITFTYQIGKILSLKGFISIIASDPDERVLSFNATGSVSCCSHFRKQPSNNY